MIRPGKIIKASSIEDLPDIVEKRDRVTLKPRQVVYARIDYELFKRLNKKSKETGISLNRLTELALEEYL